jgi:cytochrome c553
VSATAAAAARLAGGVALALLLAAAATPASAQDAAAGDARAGQRIAGARCAVCHGNDGIAVQPDSPNLAGQNAIYMVAQLRHFRSGERKSEQMNIVSSELSDAEIANLAAWYAAIEVTVQVPGR